MSGNRVVTATQSGNGRDTVGTNGVTNYQRLSIPDGQEVILGTDRRVHNVQCNNCNAWGHFARECPRTSSTVSKGTLTRKNYSNTLKYLLDTGSTHNTVNDSRDMTNIFKSKVLRMTSSTGSTMDYNTKGLLQPFNVDAYYNKNTAANILSFHTLAALTDAYMIYDSRIADCFRLVYQNGNEAQFQNMGDGLYVYVDPEKNKKFDINPRNPTKTHDVKQNNFANQQMLHVASQNKKLMTENEIKRAKAAQDLQE